MRIFFSAILVLTLLAAAATAVPGEWRLDQGLMHLSAHAQLSCQDCHDIGRRGDLHPNPENVTRSQAEWFGPDVCFGCHDAVASDLAEGRHGALNAVDADLYMDCRGCHDPHYQIRTADVDRIDSERPAFEQCGACHAPKSVLPPPADPECLSCHGRIAAPPGADREASARFCFHCHGHGEGAAQQLTAERVPLIDPAAYAKTTHAALDCRACHPLAAGYRHHEQPRADCGACHAPHGIAQAGDPHVGVACGACHLAGVKPVRTESGRVAADPLREGKTANPIHHTVPQTVAACRRCHCQDNRIGAAAAVLPGKNLFCMPCHTAAFSVADVVSRVTLIGFGAALLLTVGVYFSALRSVHVPGFGTGGTLHAGAGSGLAAFWRKRREFVRTLFWDILFQRRLLRRSVSRWLVHALIFFPFVIRFLWGLCARWGGWQAEAGDTVWFMLDKNHPTTALVFDLTGLMLLAGTAAAALRGVRQRRTRLPGLAGPDWGALMIIGLITGVGFLLEGMRIALTDPAPAGSYAFVGTALAAVFRDADALNVWYVYGWYLHAVLTGAFFVYLPFSRLRHIILAPVVLLMNTVDDADGERPARPKASSGSTIP